MALNSEIFVDKTEMIGCINKLINSDQRYVSVSRPRRFGKTMAADMLTAYYDSEANSRDMFANLKLASGNEPWDNYLGAFDVIRIVMTDFIKRDKDISASLDKMCMRILDDLTEKYPDVKYDEDDFNYSLEKFYRHSNRQFVIIIDEWDVVFRVMKDDVDAQTLYLDFLRDWMKDKAYIALAYMTGILPIKKYGQHSALNMFDEYSMIQPLNLARYTAFTEEEVLELCREYGRDYNSIKDWYDGYEVSSIIPPNPEWKNSKQDKADKAICYSLYNPLSVVCAIRTGRIMNYWNKTETYEALAEYIRKDYDGLKEAVMFLMDGGRIVIDTSTYENDMTTFHSKDDVLSLLIHLGYLGYDDETSEVFIPNKEILDEFKASTKSSEWADSFKAFELSKEILKATWDENAAKVARLLEKAHDRSANQSYNNEAALSYAIQYAYYSAQQYYTTILELDSGKGYVDIAYLPAPKYSDKPALLIELKYNKSAYGAISQIKDKDYPARLEHYKGNILMVGINYDKDVRNDDPDFKHHSCVIEKA